MLKVREWGKKLAQRDFLFGERTAEFTSPSPSTPPPISKIKHTISKELTSDTQTTLYLPNGLETGLNT